MLEGKVKHLHHRGNWKRPNEASTLTSDQKKKKYFGRQKFLAIPIQEFFLTRCGGKQLRTANVKRQTIIQVTGHTNEKSPNDYDEGNEREHRRYRTSHISRTPRQITTSNSFLRFSVWSFPTSAEQIQQASSLLAVAINNFHNLSSHV